MIIIKYIDIYQYNQINYNSQINYKQMQGTQHPPINNHSQQQQQSQSLRQIREENKRRIQQYWNQHPIGQVYGHQDQHSGQSGNNGKRSSGQASFVWSENNERHSYQPNYHNSHHKLHRHNGQQAQSIPQRNPVYNHMPIQKSQKLRLLKLSNLCSIELSLEMSPDLRARKAVSIYGSTSGPGSLHSNQSNHSSTRQLGRKLSGRASQHNLQHKQKQHDQRSKDKRVYSPMPSLNIKKVESASYSLPNSANNSHQNSKQVFREDGGNIFNDSLNFEGSPKLVKNFSENNPSTIKKILNNSPMPIDSPQTNKFKNIVIKYADSFSEKTLNNSSVINSLQNHSMKINSNLKHQRVSNEAISPQNSIQLNDQIVMKKKKKSYDHEEEGQYSFAAIPEEILYQSGNLQNGKNSQSLSHKKLINAANQKQKQSNQSGGSSSRENRAAQIPRHQYPHMHPSYSETVPEQAKSLSPGSSPIQSLNNPAPNIKNSPNKLMLMNRLSSFSDGFALETSLSNVPNAGMCHSVYIQSSGDTYNDVIMQQSQDPKHNKQILPTKINQQTNKIMRQHSLFDNTKQVQSQHFIQSCKNSQQLTPIKNSFNPKNKNVSSNSLQLYPFGQNMFKQLYVDSPFSQFSFNNYTNDNQKHSDEKHTRVLFNEQQISTPQKQILIENNKNQINIVNDNANSIEFYNKNDDTNNGMARFPPLYNTTALNSDGKNGEKYQYISISMSMENQAKLNQKLVEQSSNLQQINKSVTNKQIQQTNFYKKPTVQVCSAQPVQKEEPIIKQPIISNNNKNIKQVNILDPKTSLSVETEMDTISYLPIHNQILASKDSLPIKDNSRARKLAIYHNVINIYICSYTNPIAIINTNNTKNNDYTNIADKPIIQLVPLTKSIHYNHNYNYNHETGIPNQSSRHAIKYSLHEKKYENVVHSHQSYTSPQPAISINTNNQPNQSSNQYYFKHEQGWGNNDKKINSSIQTTLVDNRQENPKIMQINKLLEEWSSYKTKNRPQMGSQQKQSTHYKQGSMLASMNSMNSRNGGDSKHIKYHSEPKQCSQPLIINTNIIINTNSINGDTIINENSVNKSVSNIYQNNYQNVPNTENANFVSMPNEQHIKPVGKYQSLPQSKQKQRYHINLQPYKEGNSKNKIKVSLTNKPIQSYPSNAYAYGGSVPITSRKLENSTQFGTHRQTNYPGSSNPITSRNMINSTSDDIQHSMGPHNTKNTDSSKLKQYRKQHNIVSKQIAIENKNRQTVNTINENYNCIDRDHANSSINLHSNYNNTVQYDNHNTHDNICCDSGFRKLKSARNSQNTRKSNHNIAIQEPSQPISSKANKNRSSDNRNKERTCHDLLCECPIMNSKKQKQQQKNKHVNKVKMSHHKNINNREGYSSMQNTNLGSTQLSLEINPQSSQIKNKYNRIRQIQPIRHESNPQISYNQPWTQPSYRFQLDNNYPENQNHNQNQNEANIKGPRRIRFTNQY